MAAGDIRNKFVYIKNSCSCPALIPLNTKPIAAYILEELYDKNVNVFLVVDDDKLDEVKQELFIPILKANVQLVGIKESKGVNDSLKQALNAVPHASETIVQLITTLPTSLPDNNQVYISNALSTNDQWSIIRIHDKVEFASKLVPEKVEGYAFTGVFRVATTRLIEALRSANTNDLLEVVQYISQHSPLDYVKTEWMDCGHEVNYFETKKKFINSRSFNQIEVTEDNQLIKKSTNLEKLALEKNYIFSLPSDLSPFFPAVLKDEGNVDSFVMEYYNIPNVAELLLYWDLPNNVWHSFFMQCEKILKKFKAFMRSELFDFNDFQSFYFDKTTQRLNEFLLQQPNFLRLSDNYIINGKECNSFSSLEPYIKYRIGAMYSDLTSCVMHGDFCFNNILFDIKTEQIKLIDARGSFGNNHGIYGDLKYDVAKLLHSSAFGYDYLVNDLFVFEEGNDGYTYQINWRNNRSILQNESEELVNKMGFKLEEIQFIVSLLFLSMTPLHSDSDVRQKVMFLHGLYLLNENYSNYEKNLLGS